MLEYVTDLDLAVYHTRCYMCGCVLIIRLLVFLPLVDDVETEAERVAKLLARSTPPSRWHRVGGGVCKRWCRDCCMRLQRYKIAHANMPYVQKMVHRCDDVGIQDLITSVRAAP